MSTESELRRVKRKHSAALLSQPHVCGVGIEKDPDGEWTLVVHLDTDAPTARQSLPDTLDGCPVRYEVSGPFRKF